MVVWARWRGWRALWGDKLANIYHNGDGALDQTAGAAIKKMLLEQKRKEALEVLQKMREISKECGWYFHGTLTMTHMGSKMYVKLWDI